MAKKTRLGSDPLNFIKNTENGNQEMDLNIEPGKNAGSGSDDAVQMEEKTFRMKTGEVENKGARLLFEGDMTIYTVEDVLSQLKKSISSYESVIINLKKVKKIDTSGFQLLLMARKALSGMGKGISLVEPSDEVKDIFNNFGVEIFA